MITSRQTSADRWGHSGREPSVDELLSDLVAAALMRADGVTIEDVRRSASNAKLHLEATRNHPLPPSTPGYPTTPGRNDRALFPVLALLDDTSLGNLGLRHDQIRHLKIFGIADVEEVDLMLGCVGLGTEEAPLPLPVRVDLHLNCAGCMERPRCRSWLASGEVDEAYRDFCPNSWMFDRMHQVHRWRRARFRPTDCFNVDQSIGRREAAP